MKPKHYQLIIFDWDGTLLDSASAIVHSIIAACLDLKIKPPNETCARHVIGLGLIDAMRAAVPDLDPSYYPELVTRYRVHYLANDHQLQLFAGARELITELAAKGFQLAVATGKNRAGLNRALGYSKLQPYFFTTRTVDECFSKPHPQMIDEIIAEAGSHAQQTLMVGDTSHDLQMAQNAGVASIAAAYGAHPAEILDRFTPLIRCNNFAELADYLRTLEPA